MKLYEVSNEIEKIQKSYIIQFIKSGKATTAKDKITTNYITPLQCVNYQNQFGFIIPIL